MFSDSHAASQLANLVNAAILISAWSAAASDVYISSRFLFFLARRGHAPTFLATLTRFPRRLTARNTSTGVTPASVVLPHTYVAVPESAVTRGLHAPSEAIRMTAANQRTDDESSSGRGSFEAVDLNHDQDTRASSKEASEQKKPPTEFIIPLVSVLASSSVGLLAFLSATKGGPSAVRFRVHHRVDE
jgi:amino acid transporter